LRWSTIIIDKISIVEAPQAGRVDGPSFRYFSDSAGSSDFKIDQRKLSAHRRTFFP
jgi:hypothetical protein